MVKYLGNLRQVGWASQEPAGCQEGRGSTVRGRERGRGSACWVLPPAWYGVGPRLWGGPCGEEAANLSAGPPAGRSGKALEGGTALGRLAPLNGGAEAVTKASAASVRTSSPFLLLPKPSKSGCSAYRPPPRPPSSPRARFLSSPRPNSLQTRKNPLGT